MNLIKERPERRKIERAELARYLRNMRKKERGGLFHGGFSDGNIEDYKDELGVDVRRVVRRLLKEHEKIRVLDIGCGEGETLMELKKEFPGKLEVHGTSLIEYPNCLQKEEYHIMHAENLRRFPESYFNLVISNSGSTYAKSQIRVIEEVYRILTNEGIAFLSLPTLLSGRWIPIPLLGLYAKKLGVNIKTSLFGPITFEKS